MFFVDAFSIQMAENFVSLKISAILEKTQKVNYCQMLKIETEAYFFFSF